MSDSVAAPIKFKRSKRTLRFFLPVSSSTSSPSLPSSPSSPSSPLPVSVRPLNNFPVSVATLSTLDVQILTQPSSVQDAFWKLMPVVAQEVESVSQNLDEQI